MNASFTPIMLAAALLLAPLVPAAAATPAGRVAWVTAASDAEVDRAFATAKAEGKPVFLYWGAVWCPPCNQVKATLFNRPDFVERSRAFVPVYVDGDKAGAQKVASRFKVSGYPTMVLFKPDGTEVTRLPGEVDPERYLLTLTAGMDAGVGAASADEVNRRRPERRREGGRKLGLHGPQTRLGGPAVEVGAVVGEVDPESHDEQAYCART